MVHFVTHTEAAFQSGPGDAVNYEIARPSLGELRVQVVNKDGDPAGMMQQDDFQNFDLGAPGAGALYSFETIIPEWIMVLHVTPIEKNIYEQ